MGPICGPTGAPPVLGILASPRWTAGGSSRKSSQDRTVARSLYLPSRSPASSNYLVDFFFLVGGVGGGGDGATMAPSSSAGTSFFNQREEIDLSSISF